MLACTRSVAYPLCRLARLATRRPPLAPRCPAPRLSRHRTASFTTHATQHPDIDMFHKAIANAKRDEKPAPKPAARVPEKAGTSVQSAIHTAFKSSQQFGALRHSRPGAERCGSLHADTQTTDPAVFDGKCGQSAQQASRRKGQALTGLRQLVSFPGRFHDIITHTHDGSQQQHGQPPRCRVL